MITLAIGQLRRRAFRYFALFFAIFAAVALTVAASAITSSLVASVEKLFSQPYAEVDSVIIPNQSGAVREQLENMPKVQNFAFDQTFYAAQREPDGIYSSISIQAIAPGSLQWRALESGRLPETNTEVAAPAGTELGARIALRIPGQDTDQEVTVVGTVTKSAPEVLTGQKLLFATPSALAEWAPSNAQGEIRVQGATATDLKTALIDAPITTAEDRIAELGENYLGQRDRYFLLLSAFVLVAGVVAFLVVFSAYLVLTGERSREFGLVRAVGASSTQILGSVFVESALLGILASGLGAPAGLWSARILANQAYRFGIKVPLADVTIAGGTMWMIAAAGVIMSILAALPAALTVIRQPTVTALGAAAVSGSPRWLSIVWLAMAGMFGGLGRWLQLKAEISVFGAIAISGAYILSLIIVMAVVLPLLLQGLSRRSSFIPALQLGWAYAAKQKARAAAMVAVILAGAALSSAVLHGQTAVREHLINSAASTGGPDLIVSGLDGEIPPELATELAALPGIVAAQAPTAAPLKFPNGSSLTALLIDPLANAELTRAPASSAIARTVTLGRDSPLEALYPAGSVVEVELGSTLISAVIAHSNNPYTTIDPALVPTAPFPVRTMILRLDGVALQATDNPTVLSIREKVASFDGRYTVNESFSARSDTADMVSRITTLSTFLAIIALIIAAFGLINTVTLTVVERARDRALLGTIGITRLGQQAIMSIEMISLALPAAVIGVVAGGLLGQYVADVVSGGAGTIGAITQLSANILGWIVLATVLGAVGCGLLSIRLRRQLN